MKAALLIAAALALAAPAAAQTASEWRTPDPQNVMVIDTSQGRIVVELNPQLAPRHVARVQELTRRGFYDGLKFFRVIDSFMAQTGDPLNNGTGGSDLPDMTDEFVFRRGMDTPFATVMNVPPTPDYPSATEVGFVNTVPVRSGPAMQMMATIDGRTPAWSLFCPGVFGMAKSEAPDSANSQFFLMRQENRGLNQKYTSLGRVLSGLDVVRKIKAGEPVVPPQDEMTKVRLLADIPATERPSVQVLDTRSASFKAALTAARAKAGAAFSICDVETPAKIG